MRGPRTAGQCPSRRVRRHRRAPERNTAPRSYKLVAGEAPLVVADKNKGNSATLLRGRKEAKRELSGKWPLASVVSPCCRRRMTARRAFVDVARTRSLNRTFPRRASPSPGRHIAQATRRRCRLRLRANPSLESTTSNAPSDAVSGAASAKTQWLLDLSASRFRVHVPPLQKGRFPAGWAPSSGFKHCKSSQTGPRKFRVRRSSRPFHRPEPHETG